MDLRNKIITFSLMLGIIGSILFLLLFQKYRHLAKRSYSKLTCDVYRSAIIAHYSIFAEQMSLCDITTIYSLPRSVEVLGFFGFEDDSVCDSPLRVSDFKPSHHLEQKYCQKCGRSMYGYDYAILLKADGVELLCEIHVALNYQDAK